jgi:Flp pilus assembly protein TadD
MSGDKAKLAELLEEASNANARENYDQAIALVREALKLDPNDARALSLGATILMNLDQLEEAEDLGRRAADAAPRNADIVGIYGSILRERGRAEEAVEVLRKALELIRRDTEFCRIFVSADLALALADQGEFQEALRILDDAGEDDESGVLEITRQRIERVQRAAPTAASKPN